MNSMSSFDKVKSSIYLSLLGLLFIMAGVGLINIMHTKILLICVSVFIFIENNKDYSEKPLLWIVGGGCIIYMIIALSFSFVLHSALFHILFFIALLVVMYTFYKDQMSSRYIIWFISLSTFLFSIIFFLTLLKVQLPWLNSWNSEQFVKIVYGHNHVGHLAAFCAIMQTYFFITLKKKSHLILLFFYLCITFISFSRTAYLAYALSLIVLLYTYHFQHLIRKKFIYIGIFLIIAVSFVGVSSRRYSLPFFELPEKSLFSMRPEYWRVALNGVLHHPFGVGYGGYASLYTKYTHYPNTYSTSAHNIFLDGFVEYGVVGGLCLLILILLFLSSAIKKIYKPTKNIYVNALSYGFISLFVSVNFDLVYTIPVFLLLFVAVGSILYEERKFIIKVHFPFKQYIYLLVILSIFILFQYALSDVLYKNHRYREAVVIFPLKSELFVSAIQDELMRENKKEVLRLVDWYVKLHGKDPDVILNSGNIYKKMKLYTRANQQYDLYISLAHFPYEPHIEKIYNFKKNFISKDSADKLLRIYCSRFKKSYQFHASEICRFEES